MAALIIKHCITAFVGQELEQHRCVVLAQGLRREQCYIVQDCSHPRARLGWRIHFPHGAAPGCWQHPRGWLEGGFSFLTHGPFHSTAWVSLGNNGWFLPDSEVIQEKGKEEATVCFTISSWKLHSVIYTIKNKVTKSIPRSRGESIGSHPPYQVRRQKNCGSIL